MAYLDARADRSLTDWRDQVEAARLGAVYSTWENRRAYAAWRRRMDKALGRSSGLVGAALERAVAALEQTNPEYVVRGTR